MRTVPTLILRLLLFFVLLGLACFELRLAIVAQSAYSGVSQSRAIRKYQTQPRFLVAYGQDAYLAKGDLAAAGNWYQKALFSNPLYIPAWLALAELYNDEGSTDKALAILDYVDGKMEDIGRWRWEKAMLAFQLQQPELVRKDIAWMLAQEKISEQTKQKAVKLAFSLWPDPDELLENMGQDNIERLFRHAVRSKNYDTALSLWPFFEQEKPEAAQVLAYINLLINSKEGDKIREAGKIWQTYYSTTSKFYNGDFAQKVVGSGFGWRIWKTQGVTFEQSASEKESSQLHLQFSGSNLNYYHSVQFIVLTPEYRYQLSGRLRSRGLSTDQKPFIEIRGLHCAMKPVTTDMVQMDQEWTPFFLVFNVPEQCNGVMVRVRRRVSKNIDNQLKGDLWLTGFSIRELPLEENWLSVSGLEVISEPPISPLRKFINTGIKDNDTSDPKTEHNH